MNFGLTKRAGTYNLRRPCREPLDLAILHQELREVLPEIQSAMITPARKIIPDHKEERRDSPSQSPQQEDSTST